MTPRLWLCACGTRNERIKQRRECERKGCDGWWETYHYLGARGKID